MFVFATPPHRVPNSSPTPGPDMTWVGARALQISRGDGCRETMGHGVVAATSDMVIYAPAIK